MGNPFHIGLVKPKPESSLSWTQEFILSQEEAEKISEPEWIYEDLVIQGHVVVIVAEPNAGKTTLMFHLAAEMAQNYEVFYVNADISGGDAKQMVFNAQEQGFTLMLPDMAGSSMDEVVSKLALMNQQGGDFTGCVFIFDTLKKMTDVINKNRAKELYKLFRSLSAKGMTIILLAHTNKHKGPDDKLVYEGTADLRSDVDELIYLIPERQVDGSTIVSTEPDKVRGIFSPISFEISSSRQVKALNSYIDTAQMRKQKAHINNDSMVIEAVTEAIQEGHCKQTEIVEYCKSRGIGWRKVDSVLKRYLPGNYEGLEPLWSKTRAMEKNAWLYQLSSGNCSPEMSGESEN